MSQLLPKDRSILEKGQMEFRPFGLDIDGRKIRDASGITVRANVEYLREVVSRARGEQAAAEAVEALARLLNQRIPDSAYHVTPQFLLNQWNSYSYEFVMFLAEFCIILSGDQQFQYHMGQDKLISPIIQALGRPFGVHRIYKMFPHFGQKYAKGSIHFESETITDRSAVLRMKFHEHVYQQFGPYRKSCSFHVCQSSKAALAAFPFLIYGLSPATITDRRCMAEGDEYCEWEFTWVPREPRPWGGAVAGAMVSALTATGAATVYPTLRWPQVLAISAFPGVTVWLANWVRLLSLSVRERDRMVQEQARFSDTRHEELREAYLVQEQAAVDLKRRIGQLTLLYQTGMMVSSTLDREALIHNALHAIKHNLHFDRVMISFFDAERKVAYDARLVGVPAEVAAFARSLETPTTDSSSIEGELLIEGRPILVQDITDVWDRLHPLSRKLAEVTHARSIVAVPLRVKGRVIGSLTVDRHQHHALNAEDLDVMMTVANQLAIALEHAAAYNEVEELNASLEEKVRMRTAELETANDKLQELNQLKSAFVSVVSHELRTPLTAIRSFVENMLDGMTGNLNDKQSTYLKRMLFNVDRLSRLIVDLLDLSRIEAGRMEIKLQPVDLADLVDDIVDGLRSLAAGKSISVEVRHQSVLPHVAADRDHITQVLTNLIGNAVKFTPPQGTVLVSTCVRDAEESVQISVADTGCGIAHDELPRVFDKFFRGAAISKDARGAGLGLAIAKSLVELNRGQIWVESVPGEGSTFSFTIPCQAPVRDD